MQIRQTRADETRRKLLQLTARILATEGYAAWSEEYLCRLGELSRGALRYHFPGGRRELMCAFAEDTVQGQAQRLAALNGLKARERLYLVLLGMQARPPSEATVALLELWMAARGDRELASALEPLMQQALMQTLGPDDAGDEAEILALRMLVHGASLYACSAEFAPEKLHAAIAWLLERLPPPPGLGERLQAFQSARSKAAAPSEAG